LGVHDTTSIIIMQNFIAFDTWPHLIAGVNTAMCVAADSAVVTAACELIAGSQRATSCLALGAAIAVSIGMRRNARMLIAHYDRIADSLTKSRLRDHLTRTVETCDPVSIMLGAPTRRERLCNLNGEPYGYEDINILHFVRAFAMTGLALFNGFE
jgi:hypothetical protein